MLHLKLHKCSIFSQIMTTLSFWSTSKVSLTPTCLNLTRNQNCSLRPPCPQYKSKRKS